MTKMLMTALSVPRGLGLPVFPCVEICDANGKVSKRPYIKTQDFTIMEFLEKLGKLTRGYDLSFGIQPFK